MGTGDLGRMPQQRNATGVPGKAQGRDLVGIVEGSSGVPGPRGQYSGKIRFIEKPGVLDVGCRHVAKRSSEPLVTYPEVKVQVRDLVRVVDIVAPFVPRAVGTLGKFFLPSPRW